MDDGDLRVPQPPPSRRTSILPAMAVLGIAVLTLITFGVVDLWTSPTVSTTTQPPVVVGGLRIDPRSTVFSGAVEDGNPPATIAAALIAPFRTRYVGSVPTGGGQGIDYDLEWMLSVPASRASLLGFYEANLRARGWTLYSQGAAPNGDGDELLFQRGSEGNYWELGVVARPTSRGTTTYTVRLYVFDDSD